MKTYLKKLIITVLVLGAMSCKKEEVSTKSSLSSQPIEEVSVQEESNFMIFVGPNKYTIKIHNVDVYLNNQLMYSGPAENKKLYYKVSTNQLTTVRLQIYTEYNKGVIEPEFAYTRELTGPHKIEYQVNTWWTTTAL